MVEVAVLLVPTKRPSKTESWVVEALAPKMFNPVQILAVLKRKETALTERESGELKVKGFS